MSNREAPSFRTILTGVVLRIRPLAVMISVRVYDQNSRLFTVADPLALVTTVIGVVPSAGFFSI